jgi:hypothetical protein
MVLRAENYSYLDLVGDIFQVSHPLLVFLFLVALLHNGGHPGGVQARRTCGHTIQNSKSSASDLDSDPTFVQTIFGSGLIKCTGTSLFFLT